MVNEINPVLVIYDENSPLENLKIFSTESHSYQILMLDDVLSGDVSLSQDYSVVVIDLAQSTADRQENLLKWSENTSIRDSIFIVFHDMENSNALISRVVERATMMLGHPVQEEKLLEVIADCWKHFRHRSALQKDLKEVMIAIQSMEKGVFTFRSLEEARSLSMLLATLCPNNNQAALGLLELMVNGIEHGNLEISFDEKGELLKEGKWHHEVEHRLNSPKYSYRSALIKFERTIKNIVFSIEDEGLGFDSSKYVQPKNKAEEDNSAFNFDSACFHGRGIRLAAELCFDNLEYVGIGNQVKATIDL